MGISKIVTVGIIIIWLLSGLYFGIGGILKLNMNKTIKELDIKREILQKEKIDYEINGNSFSNNYEFLVYLEIQSVSKYFPWAAEISDFIAILITAFAFSLLGSLISLFKQLAHEDKNIEDIKIWSIPILGILTGLVVLGLAFIIPELLTKNSEGIQPITLMFLCLFAGMHSEKFYKKISNNFNKIL